MAAANKQEDDVGMLSEHFGGGEQRFEFMGAAKVAGVADHELVLKSPDAAKRVIGSVNGFDLLIVGPIVNDNDIIRSETAKFVRHPLANHHIGSGGSQRLIAQIAERLTGNAVERGNAELNRHFGVDVLQPVDQVSAAAFGGAQRRDRQQRRI